MSRQSSNLAPSGDNLSNMGSFQFFIASLHHTLFNEDGTPATSRGQKIVGEVGPRGSIVTAVPAAPRRTLDSGLGVGSQRHHRLSQQVYYSQYVKTL